MDEQNLITSALVTTNDQNPSQMKIAGVAILVGQQNLIPGSIKPRHLASSTTQAHGDLYFVDGNGNFKRLAPGTNHQLLQTGGNTADPAWSNTLVSPTITSPVVTTPTLTSNIQTVQSYSPAIAGTATMDLTKGNAIILTVPAGNITVAFTNGAIGQFFIIRVINDSTARTITWPANVTWAAGGTAPILTGSSKIDEFGFSSLVDATHWDACVVFQNR